ncbi:MAG TPA: efflux RND transporter periplasmic adaptor subunit [Flavipsychrobacter sp.]|nr:efflux RND transporter periplasmic adaptor subunit [Flavipsychrobacter sp.]
MRRTAYLLLIPIFILASCGGSGKKANQSNAKNEAELAKLKKERSDIDQKIKALEQKTGDTTKKTTPVSIQEVQPTDFVATVNIQSQITGDQNVYAAAQVLGTVKDVLVHPGQHVSKGQVLATLDAANLDQQIETQQARINFAKTMYEKQQNLWSQNIGTQVQLLQAKANYDDARLQKSALVAQKDMYRIVAPVSGVIDQVNVKVGDASSPGAASIRVVNTDNLKAEANLGENYLGKVNTGNPVTIVFPDLNDSIKTRLTYVAKAVDPSSRAFLAQVMLGNNSKLHPNMSCIMKIANYEDKHALVVPLSIIQKTSKGDMVYTTDGTTAKAVYVTTGANSNGQVEILSGLNAGDKIITTGFENLDNGDPVTIQQ